MRFAEAFGSGRSLLLPYLMAGVPDAGGSIALFEACAEAGADGFKIGIPYSDPLMDGPVIQEAGERALAAGMTLEKGLGVLAAVSSSTGLPCAVMTYVNPLLRFGVGRFAERAAEAGADAVIVADLPVDESGPIAAACRDSGIGLVQFAAPTTTHERLEMVAAADPPFVYGIAEMGVTGERSMASGHAADLVRRIRRVASTPVVLGVGISGPGPAATAASVADGVIVGSALVRRVLEASGVAEASDALGEAVSALAAAVRNPVSS